MDLNEILAFARVVQAGSFTGAARHLGLPKSTVSRRVAHLDRLELRALYPSVRYLAPNVRAFVDLLAEKMTPAPWQTPAE